MNWIAFALGAALLWTGVSLVDKAVIGRHVPLPTLYLAISGVSAVIPLTVLPFVFDIVAPQMLHGVLSILVGLLYVAYSYFFFRSLAIADAPVVMNLLLLVPVFTAVSGFIFFDERFALATYAGIAFVVFGVFLTSWEQPDRGSARRFKLSAAVWLMTVSAVITAVDYTLQKHLLSSVSELTLFYWSRLGVLLGVLFVLVVSSGIRSAFWSMIRGGNKAVFALSGSNEILDMCATFMLFLAYARGPLSLITTVISLQPLFVFLAVLVLNRLVRDLVPSRSDRPLWKRRLGGILVTLLGAYLIYATWKP